MSRPTKTTRSGKRREELRRTLPKPGARARMLFSRPDLLAAVALLIAFALGASAIVGLGRGAAHVETGQIVTDTRLNRLDYQVEDSAATAEQRDEARASSPRVYRLNDSYLERLAADLDALPIAVEGKESLDDIIPELRTAYKLDESSLTSLQPHAHDGAARPSWRQWVDNLVRVQLPSAPLLGIGEYQEYMTSFSRELYRDGQRETLARSAIQLTPETKMRPPGRLRDLVRDAGFPRDIVSSIVSRLMHDAVATVTYDADATRARAEEAAFNVPPVMIERERGEPIYRRGDRLSPEQFEALQDEARAWRAFAPFGERWLPTFGLIGLITVLTAFLGMVVVSSYPRIRQNPLRLVALCALMGGMLAITVGITSWSPKLLVPAAIGPTLFLSIIVLLCYDRRLAIFLSTAQAALVALATGQSVGFFIVLMAGCGSMVVQLVEVRQRQTLIRAAMVTAICLGVATFVHGAFEAPAVVGALRTVCVLSAVAALTAVAVGFLVLGMLPSIEKTFDITTGMTLAELRDPAQPLLRQLQQLAPGSYNHSLQVATIAEAAADAIDADSLLVYVGALYHDVGKMNKPQYFIENQSDGPNKHASLRPAMSLLVIIGHVKDGIELAREYGLPRAIQHFIESHHGTTLVEYFYHAAKEQADAEDRSIDEVEFRYPGPRPRTKEAAILMLSDAVESASRVLAEPNPARIESLVREMSRKRLLDGQFDECDLTFRELGLIEDAIIARLNAIHHGRIAYPKGEKGEKEAAPEEKKTG